MFGNPTQIGPKKVGLLVVHGMGAQKEGETLAEVGDPLLVWVSNWVVGHGGEARVFPGNAARGEPCPTCNRVGAPVHVHAKWVLMNAGKNGSNLSFDVTVAESWWADIVTPPSSSKISDWLPRLIGRVATKGLTWFGLFLTAILISFAVIAGTAWTDALQPAILITLVAVSAIFLLAPALLVLGKIPGLAKVTHKALDFLILWVGDVFSYEKNPSITTLAKRRVSRDIEWLSRGRHVTIAAHSLGSLMVVDLLNDESSHQVQSLVTFGSPIKLLQRQVDKYVARLDRACPGLSWVNLYDPLDFVAGPVIYRDAFPANIRVDNCRSVFQTHSSYPDNAEQFLMTLLRMVTGPQEYGRDREVSDAIQSRRRRSFFRSAMILATAPALMGVTLALLKAGWPNGLAAAVEGSLLGQGVKDFIGAAAPASANLTNALLLCLTTAGILMLVITWVTRLYLAGWEKRREDLLSLRDGSVRFPLVPIFLLLLMAVAVILPPFLGAPLFNELPQITLAQGIAFELFPALASLIVLGWIVRLRFKREVRAAAANGSRHPDPGRFLGDALTH